MFKYIIYYIESGMKLEKILVIFLSILLKFFVVNYQDV